MVRHGVEQGTALSDRLSRRVPAWVAVAAIGIVFSFAGWDRLTAAGPIAGFDAAAFVDYVNVLDRTGRLPTAEETYEHTIPPGYPIVVVYSERLVDWLAIGRLLDGPSSPERRVTWLVLALGGLFAVGVGRRRWVQVAGALALVLAGLWAGSNLAAYASEIEWAVGMYVSMLASLGTLVLTWLIGREVWPGRPGPAVLGVAATAVIPTVLRTGVMFHPDVQFAFLVTLAAWLLIRARRRAWPAFDAVWLGAVLGLAALTRQSAPIAVVALFTAVVIARGPHAWRYLGIAAASLALVAGPWWVYQTDRLGNPIQSYLDRPDQMLERQPRTFWIANPFPELVTQPYREANKNELWAHFHAELWSDWVGAGYNYWAPPRESEEKFFASTQSVLGLFASALAIAGLAVAGLGAARRIVRRRTERAYDFPALVGVTLAVLAWTAFVIQLVRFPQRDGDPIKSNYLLFLAPVFALSAVGAAGWLWSRGTWWRAGLGGWVALYAVSYGGALWTAF